MTKPTLAAAPIEAFDFGDPGYIDDCDDAACDRWHDGILAALRYQTCPAEDEDTRKGYAEGLEQRKVPVVMPERPEGYYHMPLRTFD